MWLCERSKEAKYERDEDAEERETEVKEDRIERHDNLSTCPGQEGTKDTLPSRTERRWGKC